MSEIRDKVQEKIAEAIFLGEQKQIVADLEKEHIISGTMPKYKVISWEEQPAGIKAIYLENADQILSIPELAVVDRDAELPDESGVTEEMVLRERMSGKGESSTIARHYYVKAQQDGFKAGFKYKIVED